MNKRGQIYILAAIVLIVAIWGVVKVVNKVESPKGGEDFDFYVENFAGERAYVMDLGYLQGNDPTARFVDDLSSDDNLLNVFTKVGLNVGVVMVVYDGRSDEPWKIINFLSQEINSNCESCNEISIQPAQGNVGGLSFSLTDKGKSFFLEDTDLSELGSKYFIKSYPDVNKVFVEIDGNKYEFDKPIGNDQRVESIIFKNLDDDFVKVVRI